MNGVLNEIFEVCFQRFETWRIRCDKFQIQENVVHTFLKIHQQNARGSKGGVNEILGEY